MIVCTQDRPDEIVPCSEALTCGGGRRDRRRRQRLGRAARPARRREARARAGPRPLARPQHRRRGGDARRARLPRRRRPARSGLARAPSRRFRRRRVMVAGGPIHGLWPRERTPGWPQAPWTNYFSILSHGDADQTWPRGDFYGANWAVRRSALDEVGGFEHRWGASAQRPARRRGDRGRAARSPPRRSASRATPPAPPSAIASTPAAATRAGSRSASTATGSAMPWIEAGFVEPSHELAERLARDVARAAERARPPRGHARPRPGARRSARTRRCRSASGSRPRARSAPRSARWPRSASRRPASAPPSCSRPSVPRAASPRSRSVRRSGAALRVLAIVPAFNEEDVIEHVVARPRRQRPARSCCSTTSRPTAPSSWPARPAPTSRPSSATASR